MKTPTSLPLCTFCGYNFPFQSACDKILSLPYINDNNVVDDVLYFHHLSDKDG